MSSQQNCTEGLCQTWNEAQIEITNVVFFIAVCVQKLTQRWRRIIFMACPFDMERIAFFSDVDKKYL